MFKSISLAAALLTALTVSANAAPVLTNGGFEQNSPSGYGNNIDWDISPWVLGSGNSSNVVSVDGPGGQTWYDVGNNSGPGFDATGGAGHYLDITDGSNDFYQEFTPLCDGEVEFGAYFTTRDNANGEATVIIKDATGSTDISTPAIVSLPGGTSGIDPWLKASFTTTLSANTTYRFHVAMDDNMNIDNAFVNFGPSCDQHEDLGTEPDFVFETTKTCGPIIQKADDTLEAICEITITYGSGTFVPLQISLDESVFLGSNLTSTAITSITSADGWDCGTLPVTSNSTAPSCIWNSSSTPPPPAGTNSTTLNVTLGFSPESGQSFDDAKNCVNAHMYIGGGTFLDSGEEPICAPLEFEQDESTVETAKTCEQPVLNDNGSVSVNCQITLTYDSGDLVPDTVLLDEMFTVDGEASQPLITSISGDANWDCPSLPVANDTDSIGCFWRASSSTPPPSGQATSVFDVTVEIPAGDDGLWHEAKNCASASLHFDDGGTQVEADEAACVDINYPEEETTTPDIVKVCGEVSKTSNGYASECTITLDVKKEPGRWGGEYIFVQEQLKDANGDISADMITAFTNAGWNCDPATGPYSKSTVPQCYMHLADVPSDGILTLNVNVEVLKSAAGETFENCATFGYFLISDVMTPQMDEVRNDIHKALREETPGLYISGQVQSCDVIEIPDDSDIPTIPDPKQCSVFEPKVSCDVVNGGYQITLANKLSGTFDPTSIDVTVLTTGVTATSSSSNPLLLTLQGAMPGQTVQMSLSSLAYGAGSQPGLDLCCMGDIEVTIPDGLVCQPPRQTIMEINKSCEPFDGGEALGNTVCHLDVLYSGPAPTPSNPLVITDSSNSSTGVLSYNGQDPTTAGIDEWDCSTNSFPTTGPAVCEMHNGIDTTATAGYWDSYSATLDLYITTTDEYKNCATASVKMVDGSVVDYEACYTKSDADLEISKRALFDVCHLGEICQFEYTVSNIGTSPYNGNITLQDNITPIGGQITGINPALCNTPSDLLGSGCTGSVSLTGLGSTTFVVDYRAPYDLTDLQDGESHAGKNCVTLQDETMGEFDDPADIDGHQACTDFEIGKSLLEIEKVANGECLPNTECSFSINISTGDLPYDGRIALLENMGGLGGIITSITPLPSACTNSNPVQCILPIDLAADSTYSITVTSTYDAWDQDTSHNRNCVGVYMVDDTVDIGDWSDETLTQDNVLGLAGMDCADFEQVHEPTETPVISSTKTCEPMIIMGETATVSCTLTVTGTDLQAGETITVFDEMLSQASTPAYPVGDFLGASTVTSSESWQCSDTSSSSQTSGNCTLSSDDLIAAGGTSVLNVVVDITNHGGTSSDLTNCTWAGEIANDADKSCVPLVGVVECPDGQVYNTEAGFCVTEEVTGPATTTVKTCESITLGSLMVDGMLQDHAATIDCKITVTGENLQPGETVTLQDEFIQGPLGLSAAYPGFLDGNVTSTESWTCTDANTLPTQSGDPISGSCELSSDDLIAAGGSSDIHVVFQIGGASAIQGPLENCVTTGTSSDPIAEGQKPDICAPIEIIRCAEGEMVQDGQCIAPPTITASKTCEPATLDPVGYKVNCTIAVTSTGPLFTPYTIRDVLMGPGGMDSSKVTAITHADNWYCGGQPPYPSSMSLACAINPNGFPASLTSSINYALSFSPDDAQGDWENCMANNGEEPWGCVPIVFPEPEVETPPSLEFEKTMIGECLPGHACNFELKLTNTGSQPYQGNVAIADDMAAGGAQFTGSTPPLPAGCLSGAQIRCALPVNLPAGSSTSWNIHATFTDYQDGEGHNKNCAVAAIVPDFVPSGPFGESPAWGDQASPIGEISCVELYKSTVPKSDVITPDPVAKPVLEPFKRLVGPCKVNKAAQTYSCEFEIGVKNVGNAGYTGPIVLDDSFGQPKPRAVKTVGGEGWSCLDTDGTGTSCLHGSAQLQPGSSSSVNMAVTIPGLRKGGVFENCVGVGVGNNDRLRATLAQTVMQRLGIDGGPVDGAPGRKTREGIKVLQEKLGLAPTGDIDDALFAALGIPSTDGIKPECIQVDLPPMPQLPVSCKPGQQKNSKGICYWPKVDCPSGQQKNSAGKCYTPRKGCQAGYRLNSKGVCYKPTASLQCDSRSTVKSGSGCACRYGGMRKRNARSCVCRNTGSAPIRGVGCPKIRIERPKSDGSHGPDGEGRSCRLKINGICIK